MPKCLDVSVICDGIENGIVLHRKLLTKNSDYFKAMFTHDMLEKASGVVSLRHIDGDAFQKCLRYMQCGELPVVNDVNVEALIHVSEMLHLEEISNCAIDFLQKDLSVATFAKAKSLANKYSFTELEDVCDVFAMLNFQKIVELDAFLEMEINYVMFLVRSRKKKVSSEMAVYDAVLRWVKHAGPERKKHFDKLFNHVKLIQLPKSFLNSLQETEDLIKVSKKCCTKIQATLLKMREEHEVLLVMEKNSLKFKAFLPRDRKFKDLRVIPQLQGGKNMMDEHVATVALKEYIYTFTKDSFYKLKYADRKSSWTALAPMKCQTNKAISAVVVEGIIYVLGDESAEKFEPEKNEWSDIISLAVKMEYATVAAGGWIYALGGKDDMQTVSNTAVRYQPSSDKWHYDVMPMLVARKMPAAAELCDKIYVVGGFGDNGRLNYAEVYDIKHNCWTSIPQTRKPKVEPTACALDGKIFLVGGSDCRREMIELFDPDLNTWQRRSWNSCCIVKNSPVVVKLAYEQIL